jgi:hypothetical protein
VRRAWGASSLDHLVGAREQLVWHSQAKRLGGVEVDHQLELRCLLNGKNQSGQRKRQLGDMRW